MTKIILNVNLQGSDKSMSQTKNCLNQIFFLNIKFTLTVERPLQQLSVNR